LPWAPKKTAPDQQFWSRGCCRSYPAVSGPVRVLEKWRTDVEKNVARYGITRRWHPP
jgi:hypothetical protein